MELYSVKISDMSEEKLSELCLLIDLEKKHRIEKYISKKDKIRTLIGDILVRATIIEKLKFKSKCIRFRENQYGKLYLEGFPDFHFNISHSGDFVVCAFDNKPIGIDIEEVKHIEYEEIVNNYFSEKEYNYIFDLNFNSGLNRFYEIWTLKESYIKCCGRGLSIPLRSFSIEVDQYKNIKVICKKEDEQHTFQIFDIEPGYKIAVCSLNKNISNEIISVNQNTLINKFCRLSKQ